MGKKVNGQFGLITSLLFALFILSNCEKEQLKFGLTQSGFGVDTVYRASTDGFLVIQTSANIVPAVVGYVYADFEPEPITLIGRLSDNGNSTFPIIKDSYWKVTKRGFEDPNTIVNIIISWTPLE